VRLPYRVRNSLYYIIYVLLSLNNNNMSLPTNNALSLFYDLRLKIRMSMTYEGEVSGDNFS